MSKSIEYKTKQSEELLAYLRSTVGTHVTASDIIAHFEKQGKKIGLATIYRRLERLVDSGLINEYRLTHGRAAEFEYIENELDRKPLCFHCKCKKCGKLIHLKCSTMNHIQSHLQETHGFILDPIHTIFYGICDECND